ncbi:MAG: hypothetical protein R6V07_18815 [Armatimonadota bacterium]
MTRAIRGAAGVVALLLLTAFVALAQGEVLRFEAEDISEPTDAWQINTHGDDHWNLWSTDQNAEEKWSEGIVLRSPEVLEDRESPEDGAPPLHATVTGIPEGTWEVTLGKIGRPMGVSFDGESWQKQKSGLLGVFEITDGRFELWVDDRYAAETNPGSCYFDYLEFTPTIASANGVTNGDFEFTLEGEEGIPGWTWWQREEGAGKAELVTEGAREGERAAYIEHTGERDFAFSNRGRLPVEPRDKLTATAWVRTEGEGTLTLAFVAVTDDEVVAWNIGSADARGDTDWTRLEAMAMVRRNIDEVYVRFTGSGEVRAWIDGVAVQRGWPEPAERPDRPPVEGWAAERVEEPLGRGVVAMPMEGGQVYLGWRLLQEDPADVGFNVYRRTGEEIPELLNEEPITQTCDFVDENPVAGEQNHYVVRTVVAGTLGRSSAEATATPSEEGRSYLSIPLAGEHTFQRVGIGDLNGDGEYDYVIKQPNENVDPGTMYWRPSEGTYTVEAYLADGTFLWSRDLGWSIEQGVWYSPMLVRDLDGDGRAEVILKTAPDEDLRDEEGKVQTGPEWLAVFDGMTGDEIARTDWPSREGYRSYNLASRNLMCIAYLDGKTPCIVVDRGTYSLMKVHAWQLRDGELEQVWAWNNEGLGGLWRGQGAHSMHAVDVDGDGRDEVFLGSSVLDDNGVGLWTTGLGHPDHHYVGEIDPTRPGLEVYYGIETRAASDGCSMFDARTGEWLWGLDEPTTHVHATGMCADIDPRYPGMECYSGERDFPEKKWLWSAQGELIEMTDIGGLSPRTVYWDADLQRELLRGSRIMDFRGEVHTSAIEGRAIGFADVIGDWREEIIVSVPGQLRIYTTTIPADDRRVTLMQDPLYRNDVCIQAMGYTQCPMTSRCFASGEANLSLVSSAPRIAAGEEATVEVVVTAPTEQAISGTVRLEAGDDVELAADEVEVEAPAGEMRRYPLAVTLKDEGLPIARGDERTLSAQLEGDIVLEAALTLRPLDTPLAGRTRTQAEEIAAQDGGEVMIRDDKVGADGNSFSHWDDAGHWVEWTLEVPEDGRHALVVRYCAMESPLRVVSVDGEQVGEFSFPSTGGFSSGTSDWVHEVVRGADGQPVLLELSAGEHTVRMQNADGNGMNVDYLLFVEAGSMK